jgi:UDP-glucose 4-epimerase
MRYLVTGGAGFIGSNIAAQIVNRGGKVVILDNFSTGRKDNIDPICRKIELVEGDIRDNKTVEHAMRGADYVIHDAAVASVEFSVADPIGSSEVNINGTIHLLEAARKAGVKRFVFASSAAVYGDLPELPKREDSQLKTLSPYAASKLVSEYYCRIYNDLYGLETVCLRYFNVFGPNQDPASEYAAVIPKFINALLEDRSPTIFGDGMQTRDFVFVDDVVSANLSALETPGVSGRSYNIAGGRQYTLHDLLNALKEITGSAAEPVYKPEKPGDIKHSAADISLAKKCLRYEAKIDFKEGLRKTLAYFKNIAPQTVRAK